MKIIFLRHFFEHEFCALNAEDLKFFADHHESYKNIVRSQGHEFWIKYVITLRSFIYRRANNSFIIDEFDYVFIDLLKRLTSKNPQSLIEYITNVTKISECINAHPNMDILIASQNPSIHEYAKKVVPEFFTASDTLFSDEHKRNVYSLHINCATAFIKLHKIWETSEEGIFVSWQPPLSWGVGVSHSHPFESFLRSRWGGDLISLLKLPQEYLGWWRAPAKLPKTDCSCNSSEELAKLSSTNYANTSGRSWMPAHYNRHKLSDDADSDEDFFGNLADTDIRKWKLYEISLGPVIHPKFHKLNTAVLGKDDGSKINMGIAPWYVLWNVAFEYQLPLSFLQTHHQLLENIRNRCKKDWIEEMKQAYKVLKIATKCSTAPKKPEDMLQNAADFLLEPCVVIKLAWQPVLLQQWLAVALIEIMKFELTSLELRHWPLPCCIEPCARELLFLVADAKERILVGLLLYIQEIMSYPERSNDYPKQLFLNSIGRALPALEFLISGAAHEILTELKATAFGKPHSVEEYEKSVYLPDTAYTIEWELAKFYSRHFWHIHNWLGKPLEEPIPFSYGKSNFDIDEYIGDMPDYAVPKQRNVVNQHESQKYGPEEERMRVHYAKTEFRITPKDRVTKTLEIIKQNVFNEGAFPPSDWEVLLNKLLVKQSKDANLYGKNRDMNLTQQAILYCMLYHNLSKEMHQIDKRNSPLTWLVRLSGEIIEREQLVRAASVCSQLLKKCPVLPSVADTPYRNIDVLFEIVHKVTMERKTRLPSWIWDQVPKEWHDPINKHEKCPLIAEGIDACVQKLELRLKKLLIQQCRENVTLWENGGDVYPYSHETQYLMPCYISSLHALRHEPETKRNRKRIQNYISLLHGLTKFYEEMFFVWLGDTENCRISTVPVYVFDNIVCCSNTMLQKIHIIPSIYQYMNTFVGVDSAEEYEGVPGFNHVINAFASWPISTSLDSHWSPTESMTVMAWEFVTFSHLCDLHKICAQVWKLPPPKADINMSLLDKVYFLSCVIQKLHVIVSIQTMHYRFILSFPEHQAFKVMEQVLVNIRTDIITNFAQSRGLVQKDKMISAENMSKLLGQQLEVLTKIIGLFVAIREKLGNSVKIFNTEFHDNEATCVKNAVTFFVTNKLGALNKLVGFQAERATTVKVTKTKKSTKKKPTVTTGGDDEQKEKPVQSHDTKICRNCKKMEKKQDSYIVCESCIADKYPDVNFYCKKKCKDTWWEKEHMAEHLEYDLGLSDLCHLVQQNLVAAEVTKSLEQQPPVS